MDEVKDIQEIKKSGKSPKPIILSEPIYPQGMLRAGLMATVALELIIDKQGNVSEAFVRESNNPWFERPAIDAVLKWKFKPAELNGQPVSVRVKHSIEFTIRPLDGNAQLWTIKKGKNHDKLPAALQWETPPEPTNTLFPVYPFEQLKAGTVGKASISCIVGTDGRVASVRLLSATIPEFGAAVLAMIDGWRFKPAKKKDGAPSLATFTSEYEFEPGGRGDVPVTDAAQQILTDLVKKPERIVSLKELDQPLKPISRRPPVYPTAVNEEGKAGQALVEFFVDRNGDAQLPRIVSSTAQEFGYAAVQAVATWRFSAPKRAGKPVTVRTKITIGFEETKTKSASKN